MTAVSPCYAVDATGRVQVPLVRVEGVQSVVARCLIRLGTVRGSWLSDASLGAVDVADAIETGERYDGAGYVLAVREQLALVPGVTGVSPVRQEVDAARRMSLQVDITVDVGDGTAQTVTLGTSPYDDDTGIPWYILTRGFGGPIARGF